MAKTPLQQFHPAETLDEISKTISTEPLMTPKEMAAFYSEHPNRVRGTSPIDRIRLGLEEALGGLHYKALLMGHSGVGKSTEITRLAQAIQSRYRIIRFSVEDELDPVSFQAFDILLWILGAVAEQTARPKKEGGAGKQPSKKRLEEIWNWFAREDTTVTKTRKLLVGAEAGAKPPAEGLWKSVVGLFASLRGEIQFATVREEKITQYRLSRLSELIELANGVLDECNELLKEVTGCEWLLIGENFDREGIPPAQIERLFITYSNVFKKLRSHLLFTIPVELGYSEKRVRLPVSPDRQVMLVDVPVYEGDKEHTACQEGRQALRSLLEARVSFSLFADCQVERLIVASGGNIRDLFSMVAFASQCARLRDNPERKIAREDVNAAIVNLRGDFETRLGVSAYSPKEIPYKDRAEKLLSIYKGDPKARIPDPVLFSLLRSRAVQEFNGERWFGVHPVVVDILAAQNYLQKDEEGFVPGGTI